MVEYLFLYFEVGGILMNLSRAHLCRLVGEVPVQPTKGISSSALVSSFDSWAEPCFYREEFHGFLLPWLKSFWVNCNLKLNQLTGLSQQKQKLGFVFDFSFFWNKNSPCYRRQFYLDKIIIYDSIKYFTWSVFFLSSFLFCSSTNLLSRSHRSASITEFEELS